LICAQVSNPRGGFRQVLAPWAPEADVTVTLVNQTKTRDREFVVTREELAARASAESTPVRKSKFRGVGLHAIDAASPAPGSLVYLHTGRRTGRYCRSERAARPSVSRTSWTGPR
jgi:hypothetical protein